jgi:hypothetical protein
MRKLMTIVGAILLLTLLTQPMAYAIPDCPATFSSCSDVPGKQCRLYSDGNCTTIDTEDHHCRQLDGSTFSCTGGTSIQIQACACFTRLQMTCCPGCPEFTCGDCETQPGSQTYFCG